MLIFCSCVMKNSENDKLESIQLSVDNMDDNLEMDISNLFDSLNYVSLETNDSVLISEVSNLKESNLDYFIVSNDKVYRFSKSGKFVNCIGNKGQGPEEYISILDFQIDDDSQVVYIFDYFGRKISKYDFDGYYIDSFKLIDDYAFNAFCCYEDNLYLTSAYNSITPDLLKVDTQNGSEQKISFRERLMQTGEGYVGTSFLYELNNSLYLYHYFNDTIYKVLENKLLPSFLLQIGSLKLNYEEANINNPSLLGIKMQIMNFFETSKTVFISYMLSEFKGEKYRSFTAIYDKVNKCMYPSVSFYIGKYSMFTCNSGMKLFNSKESNSFIVAFQSADVVNLPNSINQEENNPIIVKFVENE